MVLSRFYDDGRIADVDCLSVPYPNVLYQDFQDLRASILRHGGDMTRVEVDFCSQSGRHFAGLHLYFLEFLQDAVEALRNMHPYEEVDLIGLHGQTCAHQPPSMGRKPVYSVQIGSGQDFADLIGVSVVSDFRSDDLMHGGEGAPLAPRHHYHIAHSIAAQTGWPVMFINGGNTSNYSYIDGRGERPVVRGWDCGPFNHYSDLLCRQGFDIPFDQDGDVGAQGDVDESLLRALYEGAVRDEASENFLDLMPPKSSDPQWYAWVDALDAENLTLADKVRTVQYFAAYQSFYQLRFVPQGDDMPRCYVACGGGWENPNVMAHYGAMLRGEFGGYPVLAEHRDGFEMIAQRIRDSGDVCFEKSGAFGVDDQMMEARIFADMARARVAGEAFTDQAMTGVQSVVVSGVLSYPSSGHVSPSVKRWLELAGLSSEADDWSKAWGRASLG